MEFQTQARICPKCHDDHEEADPCPVPIPRSCQRGKHKWSTWARILSRETALNSHLIRIGRHCIDCKLPEVRDVLSKRG